MASDAAQVDGRNGVLQRADVWGEAQCNCQLSGVPRLTLSFTSPHIHVSTPDPHPRALHLCMGMHSTAHIGVHMIVARAALFDAS